MSHKYFEPEKQPVIQKMWHQPNSIQSMPQNEPLANIPPQRMWHQANPVQSTPQNEPPANIQPQRIWNQPNLVQTIPQNELPVNISMQRPETQKPRPESLNPVINGSVVQNQVQELRETQKMAGISFSAGCIFLAVLLVLVMNDYIPLCGSYKPLHLHQFSQKLEFVLR